MECWRCNKSFKDEAGLNIHLKMKKTCIGVLYVCKRCFGVFNTLNNLEIHQNRKRDKCKRYSSLLTSIKQQISKNIEMNQLKSEKAFFETVISSLNTKDEIEIQLVHWMQSLNDEQWDLMKEWSHESKKRSTILPIAWKLSKKYISSTLLDRQSNLHEFMKNKMFIDF